LMVEHEIHHRGQVYIYLSLLGVATPPNLWPNLRTSPLPRRRGLIFTELRST
jgi:uncharacterized damage-inducible protein DinB